MSNSGTFRQIEIADAVNRCGGFSRAAKDLGISQPAVSLQLMELEKNLGLKLFTRRGAGKNITIAPLMEGFFLRAATLVNAMKGLENYCKNRQDLQDDPEAWRTLNQREGSK